MFTTEVTALRIPDLWHTGLRDCADLQGRDLNKPLRFGVQLT